MQQVKAGDLIEGHWTAN